MSTFKTLLAAIAVIVCMTSCGNDDAPDAPCTVIANVTFDGASASPSIVKLYDYAVAKDFDKSTEAVNNFGDSRDLLDKDGNVIKPAYTLSTTNGVNTFDNIKAGKYIAVAFYKPSGFSWPMFFYYGYATVDVSSSTSPVTQWFRFTTDSERGKFLQF